VRPAEQVGGSIVFSDDVHYFTAHRRSQRKRAFDWADVILATYPQKLVEWFPDVIKKIEWVPHAAASYFTPVFVPASDRILPIFNYLVAKVFEGMAAGCLILADRPSLGEQLTALGFCEGEHYLGTDVFHVTEDAAAFQRSFVDGDSCWSEITQRAEQHVAAHHTTAIRAKEIHALCIEEVVS